MSVRIPVELQWRNVMGIEPPDSGPTCSTEEDNTMASSTTFRTPYENHLDLVRTTITAHSKLDDDVAGQLAVEVLRALNSIPEKVR